MAAHHSWSCGVDPRPDFPTSVHGRRILEDRSGRRARLIVLLPGGSEHVIAGGLAHYRMADGADDIEFTADELDLELLVDREGERGWLRLGHFHRTERHGLSWLRHRLLTARVQVSPGWWLDRPTWQVRDEDGRLVLRLLVEQELEPGEPGEQAPLGVASLIADFLGGPPAEPASGPSG